MRFQAVRLQPGSAQAIEDIWMSESMDVNLMAVVTVFLVLTPTTGLRHTA